MPAKVSDIQKAALKLGFTKTKQKEREVMQGGSILMAEPQKFPYMETLK